MRPSTFLLLIAVLVLAACAVPEADGPDAGLTAVPPASTGNDLSPSPTIVWFPPTSTWTPFPTPAISPTVESLPGLGVETFSDDFSEPAAWQDAAPESTGGNSIIVNRRRLTLAVNLPPATLFSLRNDLQLRNFYAEVKVSVNRCEGGDAYGLLFRAAGNQDAYRYVLACNGQLRVERLQAGKANILQDWLPSGDVPPGAPGQVRLGVWAAGVELRFFLNGRHQFSLIDPVFHNGTLGLFVNAASLGGMNISFSDLAVYAVSYVSPTPSATPRKTPTPTRTPKR